MQIFGLLLVILALAFLVETLVEFLFGELLVKFLPSLAWALKYIAIAVAVAMGIFYRFDLIYLLSQFVVTGWDQLGVTLPGMIITGVAIGKGSNYLHDFLKRFFVKPTTTDELPG